MNTQMEEMHRASYVASMPSPGVPFPQHHHVFTNPETLRTPSFGDFYGGFIT